MAFLNHEYLKSSLPISLLLVIALTGCFSEELAQKELPPFVEEINLSRDVGGQVYYSLQNRKIMAWNSIYSWDLAFSCKDGEFNILVNSAKKMGIYNTGSRDLDVSYSDNHKNYNWSYDHPNGSINTYCIGSWGDFSFENPQSYGNVYIINRGFDRYNLPYRLKKLRVDGFKNNRYEITFTDVDGMEYEHLSIEKNDSFNFVYVSLENQGKVMHLEPHKNDWDVLLANYIDTGRYHNFYTQSDSVNRYLALFEGMLLNPHQRSAASDTINAFESIGFFDVGNYTYVNDRNIIGNKWYTWDQANNRYILSDRTTYVVRHGDLNYYVVNFMQVTKPRRDEMVLRFAIKNL